MAMTWNSTISKESEFVNLEPGTYEFMVANLEKSIFENDTEKIPAGTPMAKLTLRFTTPDGRTADIFENLFLIKTQEWKLCQFFTCIGLKKHGEDFVMNWDKVLGRRGTAEVAKRTYTNRKGEEKTVTSVKNFLDPVEKKEEANDEPWEF